VAQAHISGESSNLFFTCAVHLQCPPPWSMQLDPPGAHLLDEAISKMDRFCHQIHKVPITWLCCHTALLKYKDKLRHFIEEYGDEVAILEHGISLRRSLNGREKEFEGWVEEAGLSRPDDSFQSREPCVSGQVFHDMPIETQRIAIGYLKETYDRILGQKTRILASPMINADTIRVMRELGLDVSWAYNWDYFCEGINNKGCPFYPFYIDTDNHNIPQAKPDDKSVLAVHWTTMSHTIANHVGTHSRSGLPGYCLNALEMTCRSQGLDRFDYHRKVLREWATWAKWNPFMHIPLQCESIWLDEGPAPEGIYDMFPRFNSADTEVFCTQIETALEVGARPLTISAFADWHRKNIGDTTEMIWHSEDPVPEVRGKGKDQAYQPFVVFGNKHKQFWFDQSRGFNYVRRYRYDTVVPENQIEHEYPFDTEPRVYLRVKHQDNLRAGIFIREGKASYELTDFNLTAYEADPDYAAILWQANVPEYIADQDLEVGGALKDFRLVRQKNIAVLFADLKKGHNLLTFRSDLPSRYIHIERQEKVGKRYEIWFRNNDSRPAYLHTLEQTLPPGLAFGGFWWDGAYHRTLFHYGWCDYDRQSGFFRLKIMYPDRLELKPGLTRMSLELA